MIVAGFHTRNDDWVLAAKLRALSSFCDRVVVLLDDSPQSESICRQFPKVEFFHWDRDPHLASDGPRGPLCQEGRLRARTWELCTRDNPEFVVLGDTDEIPSPDIVRFFDQKPHRAIDLWYTHLVNLYQGAGQYIAGSRNIWSPEHPGSNKRGMIVRHRPGKEYRYRMDALEHVRAEPSPLHEGRAVFTETHRLTDYPVDVHYKWAHWDRWNAEPQSKLVEFQGFDAGVEAKRVSRDWLWMWDADAWIESLQEPVAVVGNGMIEGKGIAIDEHPTVLRMNNFVLDGYHEHVGRKTTAWITNLWTDIERRDWSGEVVSVFCDEDPDQSERLDLWLGMHPQIRVPRKSWASVAKQWTGQKQPSTGTILLMRLLAAKKQVNAYGFDAMTTGHYWCHSHKHGGHGPEVRALLHLAASGIVFN